MLGRWGRRALLALALFGLTVPGLTLAGLAEPASAAGPQPPGQTRSHYLTSVDPGLLSRTGTADATDATGQGLAQALVLLDAGSPNGTDGSVRLPDTHLDAAPAAVGKAVIAYGKAWLAAGGPALVLVVGTTNYGSFVGGQHASAWAALVDAMARALPGIDVRAGLDAEQEYNTAVVTRSWVEAYDASSTRPYVDFGSCTCPPAPSTPANGWTLEDVYAVAVGDGRATVLPEIYATKGGNARAWGRVVAWAQQQHPDQPVRLIGALTEQGACVGPPRRSCPGIDLAPAPAWAQLTAALGLTIDAGPDLRYLTDLSYLPVPAKRHGTHFGAPLVIALLVLSVAAVSTAAGSLWWRRPGSRLRSWSGRSPRRRRRSRRKPRR